MKTSQMDASRFMEKIPLVFGDIAAGALATSNDFYFSVQTTCPLGHKITFALDIYDDSETHWSDSFEVLWSPIYIFLPMLHK